MALTIRFSGPQPERDPMKGYAVRALDTLKKRGYRITKPRRLVLETLEKHNRSLSPYEIKDILDESGEKVDMVSIYRILECLEENHLIHRMLLQYGKVRRCGLDDEDACDLHQHDHCHHLLVCKSCDEIQEIHCTGLDSVVKQVSKDSEFKIQSHYLEFVGLCPACANKAG